MIRLALLPAGGNFVGGVLAETLDGSARTLRLELQSATEIDPAVSGIDLMPEALAVARP